MPSQARPPRRLPIVVRARAFHLHTSPLRPSSRSRVRVSPPTPLFAESGSPASTPRPRVSRRAPRVTEATASPRNRLGASSGSPLLKRQKLATAPDPPRESWLRSGRHFAHKAICEAATINVSSIAAFKFAENEVVVRDGGWRREDSSQAFKGVSSQATETEPSCSPAPTTASPPGSPSGAVVSSQTETVAPWTPQRLNSREIRGMFDVPSWIADVLYSDEYDSDTMEYIERFRRPTTARLTEGSLPRPQPALTSPGLLERTQVGALAASPSSSARSTQYSPDRLSTGTQSLSQASSPGFELLGDVAPVREEWTPEPLPADVRKITVQLNPRNWKFDRVTMGNLEGRRCGCSTRCTAFKCLNARRGRFCTRTNCIFAATCGNSLHESDALQLSRNLRTGVRGVIAKVAIPRGEVIGQYLGHVQLFGPPCRNAPANEGYRMHLYSRTTCKRYVGIDALKAGGMTRFLNHSCIATTRFHQVHTGEVVTVVAVTIRDVWPGDEVTVDYGDELWFLCRCGWWGCQHRHLQHLPDIMSAPSA